MLFANFLAWALVVGSKVFIDKRGILDETALVKSSPMERLGIDTNHLIFSLLKGHLSFSDLKNIRSVNKNLKSVIDPLMKIWASGKAKSVYPNLVMIGDDLSQGIMKDLKVAVNLIKFQSITVSDWRLLASIPVNHLKLTPTTNPIINHEDFNLAVHAFRNPNLNEITIEKHAFTNDGSFFTNYISGSHVHVKKLNLNDVSFHGVSGNYLGQFLGKSEVETLSLVNVKFMGHYGWIQLADATLEAPALKSLDVEMDGVFSPDSLAYLTIVVGGNKLTNLKVTEIVSALEETEWNDVISKRAAFFYGRGLARAANLESLSLSTSFIDHEIHISKALLNLRNLRKLFLEFNGERLFHSINSARLLYSIGQLNRLEHLSLVGVTDFSHSLSWNLAVTLDRLPNLKSLTVTDLSESRVNLLVEAIERSCPNLEQLSLSFGGLEDPDVANIQSLLRIIPRLKSFSIQDFNMNLDDFQGLGELRKLAVTFTFGPGLEDPRTWMGLLRKIKESTEIQSFHMTIDETHSDVIVKYLQGSKSLRHLRINNARDYILT